MARQVVINDKTRAALAQINALSNTALSEFAETATDIAKRTVPVDTGNLKDSIASDNPKSRNFRVFTQTGYGGFVELGTARMPAQPFLAPAIGTTVREFQDGDKWGT